MSILRYFEINLLFSEINLFLWYAYDKLMESGGRYAFGMVEFRRIWWVWQKANSYQLENSRSIFFQKEIIIVIFLPNICFERNRKLTDAFGFLPASKSRMHRPVGWKSLGHSWHLWTSSMNFLRCQGSVPPPKHSYYEILLRRRRGHTATSFVRSGVFCGRWGRVARTRRAWQARRPWFYEVAAWGSYL